MLKRANELVDSIASVGDITPYGSKTNAMLHPVVFKVLLFCLVVLLIPFVVSLIIWWLAMPLVGVIGVFLWSISSGEV